MDIEEFVLEMVDDYAFVGHNYSVEEKRAFYRGYCAGYVKDHDPEVSLNEYQQLCANKKTFTLTWFGVDD